MDGKVFELDIIRQWYVNAAESPKKVRESRNNDSIKKLANHYYKNGRAASMEEALHMAASLLR